jgi:tetratricopeptide (TPR) repeat protein
MQSRKSLGSGIAFMGLLGLVLTASAQTNRPPGSREQLLQYVADLQRNPDDQALREKIIKVALDLRPAPATPPEALELEGAAEYAFKNAKSEADFADSARQYEKALLVAPWKATDYFNLGVAQEKARQLRPAIQSFELYLLAAPNANDTEEVRKRIGGLRFAISRAAQQDDLERATRVEAAREEQAREAKRQSAEGTWKYCSGDPTARFSIVRGAGGGGLVVKLLSLFTQDVNFGLYTQNIAGNSIQFVTKDDRNIARNYNIDTNIFVHKYNLTLSTDGTRLSGKEEYYFKGKYEGTFDVVFCRQE